MFAHIRPIFLSFLAVALGLYFAQLVFCAGQPFFLISFLTIFVLGFALAFFAYKFKTNKFFKWLYKVKWATLTIVISFMVGVGLFYIDTLRIQNSSEFVQSGKEYNIIATVEKVATFYDDKATLIVRDAVATYEDESIDFSHNIYLNTYLSEKNISLLENIKKGDVIFFKAKLRQVEIYSKSGLYTYALKEDFRHIGYASSNSFEISTLSEQTMVQKAQEKIKNTLFSNMDAKFASIAYGIFLGDTSYIDQQVISNFKISGVAHLLAVSGLNVGFIVVLLSFLLKLCRAKPWVKILTIGIVLLLYCILCDMAVSVVRATIMALLLLLGGVFGKQTDSLNSVSLAGLLILLVCPWQVFDASFLLSFSAVFAIILLGPVFNNFFLKCKLGKFVSSTLSLSLAAQIGTTPFLILYFGYISSYSLFANFIIVPFLGYVYMAMFVALIVTLILPFMGFLLWVLQWGYWLLDIVTNFIAGIPYAVINFPSMFNIVIFVWCVVMFLTSYHNVLPKKMRTVVNISGVAVITLLCIFNFWVLPTETTSAIINLKGSVVL